ncbi:MAG: RagB/SusD family nutrient uptake outer membrane protein [Bacteroidales bacterium]|nr:RagB/SusD family nutrient uptake outer membrane protein [Bacteroidales bacterium]
MKHCIELCVTAVLALSFASCNDWLDVRSSDEIIEKEAFQETEGFRTALVGVYRLMASPSLWGRELSWGLTSNLACNYQYGTSDPAYRPALNATSDPYANATIRSHIDVVWEQAYTAIANINELLARIEETEASAFEAPFEKEMIIAEARGLRGLLHFTLMELFVPAPVTGYDGEAIPYVTQYPDYQPAKKSFKEFQRLVAEDLTYAADHLYHYDVEEGRNKAVFQVGANNMQNMDYYLYQNAGAWRNDGTIRDNKADTFGFFVNRGYRLNWWGCTALLARYYSYLRDFDNAEKYADVILNDWVNANNFMLYDKTPQASTNPNLVDAKRRTEQLVAFYNNQVATNWSSVAGSTYYKTVNPTVLYDDTQDYRLTNLLNGTNTNARPRMWELQDAAFATTGDAANIERYSRPLIPVLELPELYFIKAECLARKGDIPAALKCIKDVRDARQCLVVKTASDLDSFMDVLVDEAQREFFTRGTAFLFLKKLDLQEMYNGTAVRKQLPEGWYVLPIPESETTY